MAVKISEELEKGLISLIDQFEIEDRPVRERQIRQWRKLKLYFEGFSRIWYNEVAHDWRIWGLDYNSEQGSSNDAAYYDKPVNVFRAYLESIIAALSITIPAINCVPDDPDNPLDVSTARAGNHIFELVSKHNNTDWLWLHALFILCTEGLTACYNYTKEDPSYGTVEKNKYEEEYVDKFICDSCGTQLPDDIFTSLEYDEFAPDDEDIAIQDAIVNEKVTLCPECGAMLDPALQKSSVIVTKLVGTFHEPKARQCMEVYGGLFVKVPNYAMKQADIPYLGFCYETHYSNVIARYHHLKDQLDKTNFSSSAAGGSSYESWARVSTQYRGALPINTVTCRNFWLRPSAFSILDDSLEDEAKKHFPNGAKVVLVNELFCEAENESLDDCWTLTHNPLSDYLHHDPWGMALVSVQDITNDIISLTLQTIEQGIQSIWADPAVIDLEAYRNTEATPGAVYPTKQQAPGADISKAFFASKSASLSPEVMPFASRIQDLGQLASGALPSLGGFAATQGSKTASEYAMSRQQAQQRLGTSWKMLCFWWKTIWGKVIPAYIKDMIEDERLVRKDKDGNYVNILIKLADVQGKIGDIELENSESLPVTDDQKKEVLMKLIELNNPMILQALALPENLPMVRKIIGIDDFELPGEEDRIKQYEEIQLLTNSAPLDEVTPSVSVDPELDNHQVEADVCRAWLVSEIGREMKVTNPEAYLNVLLHYKQHMMQVQMMMQAQMMAASVDASNTKKPNGKVPEAPVKGNADVQTPIQ